MAIDSARKRRSAAGANTVPYNPCVTPSTKDEVWRSEVGWRYSGINAGPPEVVHTYHRAASLKTFGRFLGKVVSGTFKSSHNTKGTFK